MTDLWERAKVHVDRGQWDDAINCLEGHLNSKIDDPDALMVLACGHIEKGHFGLAVALNRYAISLRPRYAEAWRNLGSAYKAAHKPDEAKKAFLRALELETARDEKAKVLACLGSLYVNEGAPEKGLAYFDRAMAIAPNDPAILWNRSLLLLEVGRWKEGFGGYEYRFPVGKMQTRKYGDLKAWQGEKGKRVIVWGEQGVGDEILFASVLNDAIRDCSKVIFDCHPRLVNLFKRSFPGVEIQGTRKVQTFNRWYKDGMADAHISLSSLPALYRHKDEDFTGVPFLKADPIEVAKLRGNPTKPRIGISWAGGTHGTRTDLRSVPLDRWLPILKAVDADFFSLQYTADAAREVCKLEEDHGVRVKHMPGLVEAKDYDKTASFVASMDLVITVCTSIHHLAGGLGVQTWTLVPSKPAWRYGLTGSKCPWYGSVNLVRQKGDGWAATITETADVLRNRWREAA